MAMYCLKFANFPTPVSFNGLNQGHPFWILG